MSAFNLVLHRGEKDDGKFSFRVDEDGIKIRYDDDAWYGHQAMTFDEWNEFITTFNRMVQRTIVGSCRP